MLEYLFNKIVGLGSCSFIKKRIQHRCFPVNTEKFLKIACFKTTPPPVAASENCKFQISAGVLDMPLHISLLFGTS